MGPIPFLSDANWLTLERVKRVGIIFALLGLVLIGGDAWLRTRAGLTAMDGGQLGRDFINYWSGAHMAAAGQSAHVYDLNVFTQYERAHTAANADLKWYSYPPVTLLLSLPLAAMGFVPGLIFWSLSGILICALMLRRYLDWRMALLAAAATPASVMNVLSGQNGQFSAALFGGGILLLEQNPWIAGLLFGLLAFKPHLAVLVPVALAAGGYWRAFIAAAVTALALCGISLFLFGPETWSGFLHNAPINVDVLENGIGFWARMPTPFAAIRLAGGSITAAYAAQALSAAMAVWLMVRVWRSEAALGLKGCALILATFLTTPYAWDYDLVALIFAVLWFVSEARGQFRPYEKSTLALVIAMPLLVLPLTAVHLQLGIWVLWGGLLVTARRATNTLGQLQPCAKQQT